MTTTHTPPHPTATPPAPGRPPQRRWTVGRVVGLSVAAAAVLASGTSGVAAAGVHLVDEDRRVGDYLMADAVTLHADGHAVTVEEIDLDGLSGDWLLGTARLRATSLSGGPVFIGVAPADEVDDYLAEVDHAVVTDLDGGPDYDHHDGGSPEARPAELDIWDAQATGTGTQAVTWKPHAGDWAVVVMNADASSGVAARVDVGATAPILPRAVCWLTGASIASGATAVLALLLVLLSFRRRREVRP